MKNHTRTNIQAVIGIATTFLIVGTVVGCASDSASDDPTADVDTAEMVSTQAAALSVAPCAGCVRIDPLSLNPPAVQEDLPYYHGTAYDCWKRPHVTTGASPTVGADLSIPGGVLVECFHGPSTHTKGDGTLSSDPNGNPDGFFGFDCPNGVSVLDVGTVFWPATARYYDKDLKLVELVKFESIRGKLYNGATGKSVQLVVDNIGIERTTSDGLSGAFVGNDFTAIKNGKVLAASWGVVQYNYGSLEPVLLIERGPHPLDDYYGNGDDSGLQKVCNALK